MRPVSVESDGPAPKSFLNPLLPGPLPASEMSLLHSLGPVQSWLGQELEKCGIDAMIYTRYVLSLLLHDSYDYDLQDQVRHVCRFVICMAQTVSFCIRLEIALTWRIQNNGVWLICSR